MKKPSAQIAHAAKKNKIIIIKKWKNWHNRKTNIKKIEEEKK